ncbi:MAG: hypothetical protein ACQEQF_00555 [Bacillota bacterium]
MKLKTYLKERNKTDIAKSDDDVKNILHMVIGLITEIDEVINCKSYDLSNEVGDLLWYLYKPLGLNNKIFSTSNRFNKIHDLYCEYSLKELKIKSLDSYKKVKYQNDSIDYVRSDGHSHLEIFSLLMQACYNIAQDKIKAFGVSEEHILESNISKIKKEGKFYEK